LVAFNSGDRVNVYPACQFLVLSFNIDVKYKLNNIFTFSPAMDAQLLAPLTQLTALSQSLFLSLSQQSSQKQVPPPPLSSFAAVDVELQTALTTAAAHQRRQSRIVALQQELLEVDARWRAVCVALEEGRKVLDEIVKEGDERVECIRKAKEGS
jgi:mediator of RNA polymerase II transcription subunit 4